MTDFQTGLIVLGAIAAMCITATVFICAILHGQGVRVGTPWGEAETEPANPKNQKRQKKLKKPKPNPSPELPGKE